MKSIGSPTEFCHEIGLHFATDADRATPFEDIETALRLIRENAKTVDSIELESSNETVIFETLEDGEDVDYVFVEDTLYRRS